MGIQRMLTATSTSTNILLTEGGWPCPVLTLQNQYLPTMSSSISDAFFLMRVQISIVKIVEDELKIDVKELISAANITASIRPVRPEDRYIIDMS